MKRKRLRWLSSLLALTLLMPSSWLVPTAAAADNEPPNIPVLLYHRVVENPTNEWTDTSIEKFQATMKYLHDHGFNTLSAQQYVDIMNGNEEAPDKPVLLTFDDATPDFVTNVVPVLDQYNMSAVQFLATGWINGYSLSMDALEDLAENHPNISIQNHSVHHADNTWNSISKEDAAAEISEADEVIRSITGEYPILFAYPYGHHHAGAHEALAEHDHIQYAFKVGYPNDGRYALGRHYVMMDTTLQQIASWLGGPEPEELEPEAPEVVVYHETFAEGLGIATKAGSSVLSPVSDAVFPGNEDGAAVHVTGRTNNWDGIDIPFNIAGMLDGVNYSITITGYIAEGTEIPEGAQVLLQNVDSYNGLYVNAPLTAGEAFTLKGSYTVDTASDRALRIQSNDHAKEVSFYIGDILITSKNSSGGEQPPDDDRPPALPFNTITFEDEQLGGFESRHGDEVLTITDEANHTDGGSYALKVENRNDTWHGPSLRVEQYVNRGHEYKVSAWVKLISPAAAQLQLSTQIGNGDGASYNNIQGKTVSVEDGWVLLEGTYRYNSIGDEYITIYVESSNSSTASFYIDDISFVPTGSGVVGIEKDLPPLKEVYKDYFLIGNAISLSELEGTRLELLKLHHNLVTAENAMKPLYAYDEQGEFDFTAENQLVDKVLKEGFSLHGHVLVWHAQSREELHSDAAGNPLPREEALANLETHVKTAVANYGDKVISWDVVNEAMNDNPATPTDWKASLRQSGWLRAIGPEYIEYAYRFAKEVIKENGWDIKLYYNDYNDDNQRKAEAIYHMVKEINENYAAENDGEQLIDGIGMQAHYNLNTNPENVKLSLERFISLGVEVGVTELDIMAGSNNVLTEEQAMQQAFLYAQLFKLYKEYSEHISRVTLWGLDDGTSWRAENSPLLFDKDLKAKPAYYAVLDPDKFIEEYDDIPDEIEANTGYALFGTPAIDGEIDEIWNEAPKLPINRYQMAWQGASGYGQALWDAENLYVLIHVSDSSLDDTSANEWEQDSIEVFVDEQNDKATYYKDDDGQYRVNYKNVTSFNPTNISEGFESAAVLAESEDGYIVELKIPFRTITAENNHQIGFDLQINDGHNGARQSVATWNDLTGSGFENPSVFGVLKLVEQLPEEDDDEDDDEDTPPRPNPGSPSEPAPSNPAPSTGTEHNVISPVVTTEGNKVIGKVSLEQLNNAIASANTDSAGNKSITIRPDKHNNADSYEIQLPAKGLSDKQQLLIVIESEFGTATLSSEALQTSTDAEHISIVISPAATEHISQAALENIGDRPTFSISLHADKESVEAASSNAAITVSIPYTPSEAEKANPEGIVIYQLDEDGNATVVINGRYDEQAGAVVFQSNQPGSFAIGYKSNIFTDLEAAPWAAAAIHAMSARNIITGMSEDSFNPQQAISRADFITLLIRALSLEADGQQAPPFADVQANAYYADELSIARALGIISGYSDNSFRPTQEISRQEMMVMAARAMKAAGINLAANGSLDGFTDADKVAGYAQASASALVNAGIINGKNGGIAPHDATTRAEAAVILYRIWHLL